MTDKTTEQTTGFEGETCEGCVSHDYTDDNYHCSHHGGFDGEELHTGDIITCNIDDPACEHFKPDLACRAVLAAEESNVLKRREVEAIERLLEIARRGFPALLIRQDGSYVDSDEDGGICEDCMFPTDLCPINEVTFRRDSPIETCTKHDNGSND